MCTLPPQKGGEKRMQAKAICGKENWLHAVVHACDLSTLEAEAGRSLKFETSIGFIIGNLSYRVKLKTIKTRGGRHF